MIRSSFHRWAHSVAARFLQRIAAIRASTGRMCGSRPGRSSAAALALCVAALLAPAASASGTSSAVRIEAGATQVEGSGLTLTIGLTPGGDGSSCGTASAATVHVGDIVDLCYTVTNHGPLALAYSTLVDSRDGNLLTRAPTPLPVGGSYVYHRRIVARENRSYEATWKAQDLLAGYVADDTAAPAFVDIRATGTRLAHLDNDPSSTGSAAITVPFAFPFYGTTSSLFCISNNGVLVFGAHLVGTLGCELGNANQPLAAMPSALIAPYWDTLYTASGGVYWEVQGTAPNRRLIVQWERAHMLYDKFTDVTYETNGRINVEAILGEDGSIAFQYLKTTFDYISPFTDQPDLDDGRDATIGLRASAAQGAFVNQYSLNTQMPRPGPSAILWYPAVPTIATATASFAVDAGTPVVRVEPAIVAETAAPGSTTPISADLSIANTGRRDLAWSFGANGPIGVSGCQGGRVPGMIVHDDDRLDNGFGFAGNTALTVFAAVDKFTPTAYPATFTDACVSFTYLSFEPTDTVDFDVVVYDDNGVDGGPGDELGAVAVSGGVLGVYESNAPVVFNSVDISGLGLHIASGSVYIGVRYNPVQFPRAYVSQDYVVTRPLYPVPDPSEGTYSARGTAGSSLTFDKVGARSWFVRAVEAPVGCTAPADVPWLSLAPTAGSVPVGGAATAATVTLDPTGLATGAHVATLCVGNGQPGRSGRPTGVPVELAIGSFVPAAALAPATFGFAAETGGTDSARLTIANLGESGSQLSYAITEATGNCTQPGDVAWLHADPPHGVATTAFPAQVTIAADAGSLAAGRYAASLCVATSDPQQAAWTIPISLTVTPAGLIFADGFDPAD